MKIIASLVCLGVIFLTLSNAKERPAAEILEYGIYSGSHENSLANSNAPTGQVMLGGSVKLEKLTNVIPARLKSKFGFRFVIHGKSEDKPVKLQLVYLFPEMQDQTSGNKIKHFTVDVLAQPEDKNLLMLWDFTESYELVPGEWNFQVYRGQERILEKKFDVVK
jgi:hypothetical protein